MMFYDLFVRSVFRCAYAITGNEQEAEEIVQDTMLKVFGRTDLLHEEVGAMERILRRMASNAAIDVVRRRKGVVFAGEGVSDTEEEEEEVREQEAYDFSVEEIKEAVALLPDVYRSVLSLRLFERMSFREMAGLLGINSSTARVQYTRGITKLKNSLIRKKNERQVD
jgi:RNA polymerase sigma-70 factor (ECF subfamily)